MIRAYEHAHEEWAGLRNPTLRTGIVTGTLLIGVFVLSLLVANRVPFLERYALERNAAACASAIFVMSIPVLRFFRSATRLFASGMLAWTILALGYWMAGLYFQNLANRLGKTTSEVFVLGVVMYGIAATLCWLIAVITAARHHPLSHARRRAP